MVRINNTCIPSYDDNNNDCTKAQKIPPTTPSTLG